MNTPFEFSPSKFLSTAKDYRWLDPDTAGEILPVLHSAKAAVGIDTEYEPVDETWKICPELIQLAIPDGGGYYQTVVLYPEHLPIIGSWLANKSYPKAAHNAQVERHGLENLGYPLHGVFCTMDLSRRFLGGDDLSLKGLTSARLGISLPSFSDLFRGKSVRKLARDRDQELLEYAVLDPALTCFLADCILAEAKRV